MSRMQALIPAQKVSKASDLLPHFIQSLDIKDSSKSTYQRQLHEFFQWLDVHQFEALRREEILAYRDYLKNAKELSALTIGGYLTSVRRFFDWLEIMNFHPNVAKGIRGPRRKLV